MTRVLLPEETTPVELKKKGGERFTIRWEDGHESVYPARTLRGRCPCAQCVSETTGERLVFEEHVDPGVSIAAARTVGNYALHFDWSDGHTTGIYAFDYLRRICPCAACAGQAA
jgi:ATP-binding protein involved in chromosome partitioning